MCASRYPDAKSTDSPHQPMSEESASVILRLQNLLDRLRNVEGVGQWGQLLAHYVLYAPPAVEGILQRMQEAVNGGTRTHRAGLVTRIRLYHTGVVQGFRHPLDVFMGELLDRLERLESGSLLIFETILEELLMCSPERGLKVIERIDKALKVGKILRTAAPDVINDVSMYIHGLRPTRPLDTLLDTLFSGLDDIHRDLVYVVSPILLARVFGGSQTAAEKLVQKAIELLGTVGEVRDDLLSHRVSIYSTARLLELRPRELRDPTLIDHLCELIRRFRLLGEELFYLVLPTLVLKAFTTPDVEASEYVKAVVKWLHDHRDLDTDDLIGSVMALLNGLCPNDLIKYTSTFHDIVAAARVRLHRLHPDFPHVVMPIIMERVWDGCEASSVIGMKRRSTFWMRKKGLDLKLALLWQQVHFTIAVATAGRLIQSVIDCLDQGFKNTVDPDEIAGAVILRFLKVENNLLKNRSEFDVLAEQTARHYKQKFFFVFRDHYVKFPASLLRPVYSLQKNCFSRRAPKTTALHKSLAAYIHDLSVWVCREDSRFRDCSLYGIGSHYSGLRTSTIPDEQDWLLSIRALFLEEGPDQDMWAERVEEGSKVVWQVYVREGGPSWRVWSAIDGPVDCLLFPVVDRPRVQMIHSRKLIVLVNKLLNHALPQVPLPGGLFHGGLLAPHFHRVTVRGPASTILLLDPECRKTVDVDVTFGMEVPLAAAGAEAQEVMTSLVKKCGLPPTAPLTLHLVPTRDDDGHWVLSSAVLEARLFAHLGPRCSHVQTVRDLKLMVGNFLSWGPLNGAVAEVTEALSAWGEGSSGGVGLRIPGMNTTGVAEAVAKCLRDGKIPDEMFLKRSDEDGVALDLIGRNRTWLVVAAVYRHHTGVGAGVLLTADRDRNRDSHGYHPESCQLCASIAETARQLTNPYNLHPAVAQALRLPVRPWLSLSSAYIKYLVLEYVVQRSKHGLDLLLQPDEVQRECMLKYHLIELSYFQQGDTMPHPLLGTSHVRMYNRNLIIPLGAMCREYLSMLHLLESLAMSR